MRRNDREINDINEIVGIMKKCDSCSLAIYDQEYPYIIPLNFGIAFDNNKVTLYFHSANAGKKLELINKNNRVAFSMDCSHKLLLGEASCNSTMEYESVCGNGTIEILDGDEKVQGLTALMNQYAPNRKHKFDDNEVRAVAVLKLTVNQIIGKRLRKL